TSRVFRSLIRSTEFCNYLSKVGLRVPTVSLGRHEAASCVEGWTTPMVTTLLIGIILAFGATGSQAAPNTGGQQAPPSGNDHSKDSPETSESSSTPKERKSGENGFAEFLKPKEDGGFAHRFYKAYYDEFFPSKNGNEEEAPEPPRRAFSSPWDSPPFPSS